VPAQTFFNLPEKKRKRIEDIALREFAHHPYSRASVSRVAREARIAKGSIYQYFADKKDLYFYLAKQAAQAKMDFLASRANLDWSDFYGSYARMMLAGVEFQIACPLQVRLLTQTLSGPFRDELYGDLRNMAGDYTGQLIQEAQKAGQVRTDLPVDMIAFFFHVLTMEFGNFLLKKAGLELEDLRLKRNRDRIMKMNLPQMVEGFMSLLKEGLLPPGRQYPGTRREGLK
jgi:AcrR family transcriptional regulator